MFPRPVRAQQRAIGDQVDQPRNAAGNPIQAAQRGAGEQQRAAAGALQPVNDVGLCVGAVQSA
ncbi:MAG: hypothetical protein ACKOBM_03365, partial [Gammaproteobacteria bacterium]